MDMQRILPHLDLKEEEEETTLHNCLPKSCKCSCFVFFCCCFVYLFCFVARKVCFGFWVGFLLLLLLLLLLFWFAFCVTLPVLELTLQTWLALNSEICLGCLQDTCEWKNSAGRKDYLKFTKPWFRWILNMTHLRSFPGYYLLLPLITHMELN